MNGDVSSEDEFYNSLYGELQSENACGWYVAVSHRALERGLGFLPADARLLEIGGNRGEHCGFVQHSYSEYVVSDCRKVDAEPINERIHFQVADAHHLPYEDSRFDRVLVTCVLHHLADPVQALREIRRVVRPGGYVSLTIPCDPGMAYRLGKSLGPYRSLRKRGVTAAINPRYSHYQQHRNHYPGLVSQVQYLFAADEIRKRSWPWRIPSWNLNLFTIYQIRIASE